MEISRKDVKEAIIRIVGDALLPKGYQISNDKTDKRILLKYYKDGLIENKMMRTEIEFQISFQLHIAVNLKAGEIPSDKRKTKKISFSDTVNRISYIRLPTLYQDQDSWWNFVTKEDLEKHCEDIVVKLEEFGLPFLEAPFALSEEYWRRKKVMPREVRHWDSALPPKDLIEILTRTIEPELHRNGYQRLSQEASDKILPKYYKEVLIDGKQVLTEIEFHARNPNKMRVVLIASKSPSEEKYINDELSDDLKRIVYLLTFLYDDPSKQGNRMWWEFITKEDFDNQCRDILEKLKKYGLLFLSDPFNIFNEIMKKNEEDYLNK